ncbi:MAG: short-chain fatty acid transporter, partial [Oligoflexales bacterium]|nr:short-chain fatty acid transporter [Oligoflexales bacterium]
SLINWAISLVFSGLLVKALARREGLRMDYRAAGASAYLGLGATWALGLSSSAAQLQANKESLPKSLYAITGVIPFTETIFLPQTLIVTLSLLAASVLIAYYSAPSDHNARTARDLNVNLDDLSVSQRVAERPGARLEHSPTLILMIVALSSIWIFHEFRVKDPILAISNLNTYNFIFLVLGMLLNYRPYRFLEAVSKAVPATSGVLLQFPLYGGIAYILTKAAGENGVTLSHHISQFFVSISTHHSFPNVMGIYSAILGFFIPSGGGKWVIEAPYVMQAANDLKVHLGWAVTVYNAAEALPNLINPFWMLPLLGVLGIKAHDIVGYTFIQFIIHLPLLMFLLWVLALTLPYTPPVFM